MTPTGRRLANRKKEDLDMTHRKKNAIFGSLFALAGGLFSLNASAASWTELGSGSECAYSVTYSATGSGQAGPLVVGCTESEGSGYDLFAWYGSPSPTWYQIDAPYGAGDFITADDEGNAWVVNGGSDVYFGYVGYTDAGANSGNDFTFDALSSTSTSDSTVYFSTVAAGHPYGTSLGSDDLWATDIYGKVYLWTGTVSGSASSGYTIGEGSEPWTELTSLPGGVGALKVAVGIEKLGTGCSSSHTPWVLDSNGNIWVYDDPSYGCSGGSWVEQSTTGTSGSFIDISSSDLAIDSTNKLYQWTSSGGWSQITGDSGHTLNRVGTAIQGTLQDLVATDTGNHIFHWHL
jgi:hypothetical protein